MNNQTTTINKEAQEDLSQLEYYDKQNTVLLFNDVSNVDYEMMVKTTPFYDYIEHELKNKQDISVLSVGCGFGVIGINIAFNFSFIRNLLNPY